MGGKERNIVSPLVTQLTYAVTLPVVPLWVPAEICPFLKNSVVLPEVSWPGDVSSRIYPAQNLHTYLKKRRFFSPAFYTRLGPGEMFQLCRALGFNHVGYQMASLFLISLPGHVLLFLFLFIYFLL